MSKGIIYLTVLCVMLFGMNVTASETKSAEAKTSGKIIKSQALNNAVSADKTGVLTDTVSQDVDPTAMSTKFKNFFNKNEQKEKKIRSKDIVKYKEKIRKQEMLRLQKEKEIKYLERRLEEKQKTLERLEKSKGE